MDKLTGRVVKARNWGRILIWLGLLIFFIYSFQAIIDLEQILYPRREEAFVRVLTALSQANFMESETRRQVVDKIWETVQIAFLATSLSTILAIPFTLLIARTSSSWGRAFNILLQPILAVIRSIHPLIFAFLTIIIVGIGPTAGVLALTLFSTAVLIVKFSEYARAHSSLSWTSLLQVDFPGLAFRHLSTNMVIATVLGFMGGGGIGFLLQQDLMLLNYRNAGVSLFAIIIVGSSLDLLSRAVWYRIQSSRAFHTAASQETASQI